MDQTHTTMGLVHQIGETEHKGKEGTFKIRDLILVNKPSDPFPVYVKFKGVQDMTDRLDAFSRGQFVLVRWQLRGRDWVNPEGKTVYFTDLEIEGIELVEHVADHDVERGPVTAPLTPVASAGEDLPRADEVPF